MIASRVWFSSILSSSLETGSSFEALPAWGFGFCSGLWRLQFFDSDWRPWGPGRKFWWFLGWMFPLQSRPSGSDWLGLDNLVPFRWKKLHSLKEHVLVSRELRQALGWNLSHFPSHPLELVDLLPSNLNFLHISGCPNQQSLLRLHFPRA